MKKLLRHLQALFRPTPPHTEEELQRMAQSRPATDDEIEAERDKAGWRRLWPL